MEDMTGLFLVILAFVLIIAEAHVPSFGLLGIGGIVTLLFGGKMIIDQGGIFGIPVDWGFFLGIAGTAVILTGIASWLVAKSLKKGSVTGIEGMVGRPAEIIDWAEHEGRIRVQGELWSAISERAHAFKHGDEVIVSGLTEDYMKLKIRLPE
jgi:membrane-bound serine protease (ClpP class)